MKLRIIGSYLSPYVRKVLVCLELKGVAYEIDPITPFYGNAEFSRLSPLRRIPVLIDGPLALSDSTVICEYLNEKFPTPPLFPATVEQRARSRWLEEYADTRMADVFIWKYYNQLVIRRYVWNEKPDEALVKTTLEQDIPEVMGYLESASPASEFMFGAIGICDVALAVFFRNAAFARWTPDANRWPKAAAYIARVLNHPVLLKLRPFEELCMRTPIAEQRAALEKLGAPIAAETLSGTLPSRGVMTPA